MIFIAFFAFSQGAVIWVFISEIFPNQVRAKGQTLGSSTHWIMAAIIAFAFPFFAEKLGGAVTFSFFGTMMVLQLNFCVALYARNQREIIGADRNQYYNALMC